MDKVKKEITFEDVEYWLGTSNPETEAIETLVDIANGNYKPEVLKQDIIETIEQNE
jgi:hypothetical protein